MSNELPIDRAGLRQLLAAQFPLAADLDAFCVDYHPEVYAQFSTAMSSQEKLNLLLARVPGHQLLASLQRYQRKFNTPTRQDCSAEQALYVSPTPPSQASPTQPLAAGTVASLAQVHTHLTALRWAALIALPVALLAVGVFKLGLTKTDARSSQDRCDLGGLVHCLGAIQLSWQPLAVGLDDIQKIKKESCDGLIAVLFEQEACQETLRKIYPYTMQITSDALTHQCKQKKNWVACLIVGMDLFEQIGKMEKGSKTTISGKAEMCEAFTKACEYGTAKNIQKACAPLYVVDGIYDYCNAGSASKIGAAEERRLHLKKWCTWGEDDIAGACNRLGIMDYDDAERLDGLPANKNAPSENPQSLELRKSALRYYARACELKPKGQGYCRVPNCLQRECDDAAKVACYNAARIIEESSSVADTATRTPSDYYIEAAVLGNEDAKIILKGIEKSKRSTE